MQADEHDTGHDAALGPTGTSASAPIVPSGNIAGSALVAVVAIMTFLAAFALGAVGIIHAAAAEWRGDVAREMTIQVRPIAGRDIGEDVRRASEIARAAAGVSVVHVYSQAESERLLEPWLGTGLDLGGLPVPRLIGLTLTERGIDTAALRRQLAEQVPAASLDDHRSWSAYLSAVADSVVAIGLAVTVLVLAATALCVAFATRGAVAANRNIVEVLHLVGAKNSFIAGQFQRHFLILGFRGAAIGGALAALLFLLVAILSSSGLSDGTGGVTALIGALTLPGEGYVSIFALVLAVAFVTAFTTHATVRATLKSFE